MFRAFTSSGIQHFQRQDGIGDEESMVVLVLTFSNLGSERCAPSEVVKMNSKHNSTPILGIHLDLLPVPHCSALLLATTLSLQYRPNVYPITSQKNYFSWVARTLMLKTTHFAPSRGTNKLQLPLLPSNCVVSLEIYSTNHLRIRDHHPESTTIHRRKLLLAKQI